MAPLLPASAITRACASYRWVFPDIILGMFAGVTGHAQPNFRGAQLPVPTNVNLHEWAAICTTEEEEVHLPAPRLPIFTSSLGLYYVAKYATIKVRKYLRSKFEFF